tara:strand:- start:5129 stop:7147 length:2019 start_codon:yes stop_codon:yes gene_type:complete
LGRKRKIDIEPYDVEQHQRFIDDKMYAMQQLILVEHRDKKGALVPLRLNNCQQNLHQLIEKARAFRLVKNTLLSDDKEEIAKLLKIDTKQKFSTMVRKMSERNIDEVMRKAKEKSPDLDISDGPVRLVITKCRRAGVSSYVGARFYLEANFSPNMSVMVMAHKGANARRTFKYTQDFYRYWSPRWEEYRQPAQYKSRSEGYTWEHNSRYVVATAGGENAARGDQFDLHHFSESAFYDSYAEVNAALTAAPPHAMVIEESTGNGAQGGFYDRWQKALTVDEAIKAHDREDVQKINEWNGYFQFFYSWLDDPAYREKVFDWERENIQQTLDEDEIALLKAFPETTLEQIKWRRTKIQNDCQANEQGLPPEMYFAQEFPATPEESFQSSSQRHFSQRALRRMALRAKTVKPHAYLRMRPDEDPKPVAPGMQNMTVWRPPDPKKTYVIGADVAQGLKKGDWSVAIVFDRHDGTSLEEVAMLRCKVPAPVFGDMLCLLAEWYNDAYLVPEANGPGLAACARITENRYPHIYHRATMDLINNRASDNNTFRFGFLVTSATKGRILADTQEAVRNGSVVYYSSTIIEEHLAFESDDGKLSAPRGQHDDCVMAAAMAHFGHIKAAPAVNRREWARAKEETVDGVSNSIWQAVLHKISSDQQRISTKDRRESVRSVRRKRR